MDSKMKCRNIIEKCRICSSEKGDSLEGNGYLEKSKDLQKTDKSEDWLSSEELSHSSGDYYQSRLRSEQNISIEIRNARERNRVRAVNEAFLRLRKVVPYTANRSKRVSKLKTLQKALQYIAELESLLDEYLQ